MGLGPMVLEELIKVQFKQQFEPLDKKYHANQKQLSGGGGGNLAT